MIRAERLNKIRDLAKRRQGNLTVILENVHDTHNVGAVLRSCDAVGIAEIFLLLTKGSSKDNFFTLGKRTSMGARKWVDVHYYNDPIKCFEAVRNKYQTILAACIDDSSESIYDFNLTGSIALLFGNEKEGLSEEALRHANRKFFIPQMGMVQSLNISVACAVSLYESLRQRSEEGLYDNNTTLNMRDHQNLLNSYIQRSEDRDRRNQTPLIE